MKSLVRNYPKTLLFCLGCFAALGMAPVYAWPLLAMGYATLIYQLIRTTNWKQSALYSFVFFFGYYLASLYWVSSSLFVDFDTWWWALPFSFAGLPLALSLFPTVATTIASFAPRYKAIAFIFALILADILRSHLFTGFPWNLPAHSWVNNDIVMASLPTIGLTILNALTIILFGSLLIIPRIASGGLIIAIIATSFYHAPIASPDFKYNMHLIQANIPQKEKWDPAYIDRNLTRYIDMSEESIKGKTEPQIVIWPETAISKNLLTYPEYRAKFQSFLKTLPTESLLITGYLDHANGQFFNSLIVMDTEGDILYSYDKHHLVPFGEYMPLGIDTITGFSGFTKGDIPQTIETPLVNFLPLICYEVIFPRYGQNASDNTDFILNITNDAWFGRTAGPLQHLDHARFQAASNHLPLIRLSGNGISVIITDTGKIIRSTRLNTVDQLSL